MINLARGANPCWSRPTSKKANLLLFPWRLALGCCFVVWCSGCGSKGMHQVKGTVVYADGSDATVLARGLVVFDPIDLEVTKQSAQGEIQADGSFQMSSVKQGDGVVPGKYRVMVQPPSFFGGREKPRPQLLDPMYQDFETSGIEIDVDAAKSNYVITVRKPQ